MINSQFRGEVKESYDGYDYDSDSDMGSEEEQDGEWMHNVKPIINCKEEVECENGDVIQRSDSTQPATQFASR